MNFERIQIHRYEDGIGAVAAPIPLEENAFVVALVKLEVPIFLKRRVLSANLVDARDILAEVARSIPVTDLDLVFLRVPVFLRFRHRRMLAQLVATVDAVEGGECG